MIINLNVDTGHGSSVSAKYATTDGEPMHSVVYPDRVEIFTGHAEDRRMGQRPVLEVWLGFKEQLELRDGLNAAMRRTADHNKSDRLHALIDGGGA